MVAQHRPALPGKEAMTLLTAHAFPRHSHDGFGAGVMTAGAQRSWSGVGPVESMAGGMITVNPGETHNGAPVGEARGWRVPASSTRRTMLEPRRPSAEHAAVRSPSVHHCSTVLARAALIVACASPRSRKPRCSKACAAPVTVAT